jgi:hypothetical protein
MTTIEKLEMLNLFVEVLIFLCVVRILTLCVVSVDQMPDRPDSEPSQPDLMEVALANIAMRKMQIQLRELLVYGEPDDLKDLMAEYMRLKDAQDKKDLDAKQK